jgi:hypothetical protein
MGARGGAWVNFGYTSEFLPLEDLRASSSEAPPTKEAGQKKKPPTPVEDRKGAVRFTPVGTATTDVSPRCRVPLSTKKTEARKGITALRLGQILESQVFHLSVGTEVLEEQLREAVERTIHGKPAFLLIEGAWGGGKTHALTLLQAIAREKHLATSGAVMDGISVSLAEPMQLMEEILRGVCFPNDAASADLGELLRRAVRSGKTPGLRTKGARELAYALEKIPDRAFDDPDAMHHIEDYFSLTLSATQAKSRLKLLGYRASGLPTIRAGRVSERPHAFSILLKGWAQFASVMGAKGLLTVFDELDVEYAATAYSDRTSENRRFRRRALLRELTTLKGIDAPLLVAFASAPAGADVDIEDDAVDDILETMGDTVVHISVPSPDETHLQELLKRLVGLYKAAYPGFGDSLGDQEVKKLFDRLLVRYHRMPNSVPRHFVRTSLEAFDLLNGGGRKLEDLLSLVGSPA